MANNWAVAIGINQYQFFQPLGCAQADAEALKDFLVTEGGFLPQQCLLMTDTSPPLGDRSTYPTKENILLLLEDLAAACWQPQDRVWFFFSGYGVNYNGQDYLMPVEGNPDRVEETGVEVRALMQSMQVATLDVLLLLDINRAFGTQADLRVGQETIELAQELQIPTILSCQPEQFSHESSELGHGFFTAALLEALRYGNGSTLTNLETYLSVRTPELCQHYWRPTQNPVTVIASRKQVILPQLEVNSNSEGFPLLDLEEFLPISVAAPSVSNNSHRNHTEFHSVVETNTKTWDRGEEDADTFAFSASLRPHFPMSALLPQTAVNKFQHKEAENTPFLQHLLLWGATTMLVLGLIVVVFLRNQAGLRVEEILPASSKTASSDTKVVKALPKALTDTQTAPAQLKNQPSSQRQSHQLSKVKHGATLSQQRNQALLNLAKMSLRQTQASDLSLAIATARKIKPGEPLYEQAQENIKIWSSMILDLAEGRAKQRQYANAIAAAQLITKNEPLHPKAQAAINQWRLEVKQYTSNKTLLDAANALIQPRQASSYNRAIEVAKKVPRGEPGFDVAQKSINKWSEKIFDLAKKRAVRGELKAAIETAVLVPEGTGAYNEAHKAIEKWQKK